MPTEGVLAWFDWVIVATYTGGLVILGLLVSRRRAHAEDYFLASRASRWPAIGLALLASNISSPALIGLAGAAYAIGISAYDYEWTAGVVLVFFCIFLLPFVLRSRVYTMPEFLERRYDGRARLYFAALTLFLNVFVDSAGALYCGSLVSRMLFPAAPLWSIVAVLAGAAGLYTLLGGLRAVMYTETVQAVVMIAGAIVIAVTAFSRAGGVARGHVPVSILPHSRSSAHSAIRACRGRGCCLVSQCSASITGARTSSSYNACSRRGVSTTAVGVRCSRAC